MVLFYTIIALQSYFIEENVVSCVFLFISCCGKLSILSMQRSKHS